MISHQDEATSFISPPEAVRSMKVLDRKLFSRTVSLPALKVPSQQIGSLSKTLKVSLLKMQKVKPIADLAKDDPQYKSHKLFLLNPDKFKSGDDFSTEDSKKLAEFDIDVKDFTFVDMELGYENWNCAEILRAVLPEDVESVSSYSIIGHIAHLNLKPEVMDYKHLIGKMWEFVWYIITLQQVCVCVLKKNQKKKPYSVTDFSYCLGLFKEMGMTNTDKYNTNYNNLQYMRTADKKKCTTILEL